MKRQKRAKSMPAPGEEKVVALIRELRQQLGEINQKLDHLIKHYRKYHITSDFSHSSHNGFKD